ncbi:MAG: flavodoxin reductase [Gammaproteobacteria bacterium]|nr:MAG: flavodoxin reductase [Gammaproteobacteria bacterium]
MSDTHRTAFRNIVGYVEAEALKRQLEAEGSDLSEEKGRVPATINRLHPKRLKLRVNQILEDTPTTKTFRMVAEDQELPPFQAGQYVNLFVNIDGVETARPYAISSSPAERNFYDLTVKRAAGGFVSHFLLDRVQVGDRLTSTGPMGTFHYNPLFHGQELVFLAGGSGIAPARSLALDIIDHARPIHLQIIYSNSYASDVIFQEQMRSLARRHDNIELTEIITRPDPGYSGLTGRLTPERLAELIDQPKNKRYFLCGPTPFNENAQACLEGLGVPRSQIMVEVNGPPKHPEAMAGWPEGISSDHQVTVTVRGQGSFNALAGEPLLNSLERNGFGAENACRSGECSLCRVKLISGEVFNPPASRIRKSDRKFGWIHACVAFPVSDIEIDIM